MSIAQAGRVEKIFAENLFYGSFLMLLKRRIEIVLLITVFSLFSSVVLQAQIELKKTIISESKQNQNLFDDEFMQEDELLDEIFSDIKRSPTQMPSYVQLFLAKVVLGMTVKYCALKESMINMWIRMKGWCHGQKHT